jgi:hypothetical protein
MTICRRLRAIIYWGNGGPNLQGVVGGWGQKIGAALSEARAVPILHRPRCSGNEISLMNEFVINSRSFCTKLLFFKSSLRDINRAAFPVQRHEVVGALPGPQEFAINSALHRVSAG